MVQQGGLPDVVSQLLSEAGPADAAAGAVAPSADAVDFSELESDDDDDDDLPEIQDAEPQRKYGSHCLLTSWLLLKLFLNTDTP